MVRGLCSNNISSEKGEIVVYQPDEITRLEVRVDGEDVWLNRHQLSVLFGRDIKTIGKHIKNALAEELADMAVVANFATTATDGKTYVVQYYNLEMILSVGYRVKSSKGVLFRQWANKVLRECLLKDCAINPRLMAIERRLDDHEKKIDFFVRASLPPVEGVFFDGQIFDAYVFGTNLIKSARNKIVLIDNYVDESVLLMLSKRGDGVLAEILTGRLSQTLQQDLQKHNCQYEPISICQTHNIHDRFLIIDNEVYHLGASLKDLGKKLFAFSKLNIDSRLLLAL